jgi:hypothetical protein
LWHHMLRIGERTPKSSMESSKCEERKGRKRKRS